MELRQTPVEGSAEDHDPIPSYFQFMNKTVVTFREFMDYERYPTEWDFILQLYRGIAMSDVFWMVVSALIFAVLRSVMDVMTKRLRDCLDIRDFEKPKFSESCWKLFATSLMSAYSVYLVVINPETAFFNHTCQIWKGRSFGGNYFERYQLPLPFYLAYMMQLGFYIHGVYSVLYLDERKKDHKPLLIHHLLTIALLLFSLSIRYYHIGAVLILLHDPNDVIMEFTKINVYLKSRGNVYHHWNGHITTIGFIAFVLSWIYTRLYLYPLKALHTVNWCVYIYHKDMRVPLWLVFDVMLWSLMALHVYWTVFIVKLAFNVLTKGMENTGDNREEFVPVANGDADKKKKKAN